MINGTWVRKAAFFLKKNVGDAVDILVVKREQINTYFHMNSKIFIITAR